VIQEVTDTASCQNLKTEKPWEWATQPELKGGRVISTEKRETSWARAVRTRVGGGVFVELGGQGTLKGQKANHGGGHGSHKKEIQRKRKGQISNTANKWLWGPHEKRTSCIRAGKGRIDNKERFWGKKISRLEEFATRAIRTKT